MNNSLPLPQGVQIALSKVMPSANGSAGDPAIGFESDPTIGWYMDGIGNVVFTSGMDDTMLQNANYTEFKKPIMFNEFEPDDIDLVQKGILYKKPDDPGLWWLTEDGETNIAAGAAPPTMRMSQGTSAQPSFTFGSDCNSGLFLDSPGNLGVSAKGMEIVRFTRENMKVFKPIEIMDSSLCIDPTTPLTGYLYKKAGESGLWWRSSRGDVDLTAPLPSSLQQPMGCSDTPSYTFTDAPDTGMYLIESGRVGVSVNGLPKLEIKNSEIVADVPIRAPSGSLIMPGITFDSSVKTGLFSSQYGHVSVASEGSRVLDISRDSVCSLVPLKITNIVLSDDVDTGISGLKNQLDFNVAGENKVSVMSNGLHVLDLLTLYNGLHMQSNSITCRDDDSDESMYFMSSNKSIMHMNSAGIHYDTPVFAKPGSYSAPGYSFDSAPDAGMFLDGSDLCLTGTTIKLKNKVELDESLKLPAGTLFTKPGLSGLFWQSAVGEIDLTTRGLSAIPSKLELAPGNISKPAYSFADASDTGLTLVKNSLVHVVGGNKVTSVDTYGMHVHGKIGIKDANEVEVQIYKKADSIDLFAKLSNGDEINVTTPETRYPIYVPINKSIEFGNLLVTTTDSGINLADSVTISSDSIQINSALEIKEQELPTKISTAAHGVLYKEKGTPHLMWVTDNGIPYNITREPTEFKAKAGNNFKCPEFSFKNDLDTGMAKVEDNVVGLVSGGQLVLATSPDQAMLYKPIAFVDTTATAPAVENEGKLYKKAGSNGLFWQTTDDEIDLTQPRYPLTGPNGSAANPTFAFQESGYGLYKLGDTIGLATDRYTALAAKPGEVQINGKLALKYDNQVGTISIRDNNLFWNDVDLCNNMRYPIKAPDGDVSNPTYSFAGNNGLGITRVNDAITFVNQGASMARFATNGMQAATVTTGKLVLDGRGNTGVLLQRGLDLIWKPASGSEIILGAVKDAFNGGIITNDIVVPGVVLSNYRISMDNFNRLDLSIGEQSVAKISEAGIQSNGVKLSTINLTDNKGIFTVSGVKDTIMKASMNRVDFAADTIGIANSSLYKSGESLIWQTTAGPVDLTDKATEFPLRAPTSLLNNEIAYGYAGSNAGISKDDGALVLRSENSYAVVEKDGFITSIGLNTGQICADDGLSVFASGAVTKITKNAIETPGVFRGNNGTVAFGYDVDVDIDAGIDADVDEYNDNTSSFENENKDKKTIRTVGIAQINGDLGLVSGNATPVVVRDDSFDIKNRVLKFGNARLERRGSELYWLVENLEAGTEDDKLENKTENNISYIPENKNIENKDIEIHITKPHDTWYRETLSYIAAENIKCGDIICMDPAGSGKIYKGIGGRIQKMPTINQGSANILTGNCKAMSVYDYDAENYVMAITKTKLIGGRTQIVAALLLISKENHQVVKTYELVLTSLEFTTLGVLEDGYSKIIRIDADTYIIPFMRPGDNTVKITKLYAPFSMTPEKSTLSVEIGVVCESMTAEYDANCDCLVIVCHSTTTQNFAVALVSVGGTEEIMTAGTIETMLTQLTVADVNKQIHLVLVPGGTCVVSYGIMKMVFIISSYQGSITPGDAFMDYESVDCADMFYDTNNGVIMTLEKTVSGSCYLQVLDVLGIAIQKITSKGFNNANIEPLGLAYNNISGNYAILYATGTASAPVYVQTFDFNGELLTFGLRYQDQNGVYEPTGPIRHERNLFEIPGTNLFIYSYDPNVLSTFEAGYHGNPAGYLGVAIAEAARDEPCLVTIKGHIYCGTAFAQNWLGKKLYIVNPTREYPACLSTTAAHGVFFGTCLDQNRVLLGL